MRKLAGMALVLLALFALNGRAFAADGVSAVPWDRMLTNGVSVTAGTGLEEYRQLISDRLGNHVTYSRYLPSGITETDTIPAVWQGAPETANVPGEYPVTCVPASSEVLKPFSITLHIVPPGTPHIAYAGDAGSDVFLQFLSPIVEADHLALLMSDDGGSTWRDTAGMPGSLVTERTANVSGLAKEHTYWFQLVVTGGPMEGRSKPIEFPWYANMADYNGGGDRDLGDRDEQNKLPPAGDLIPPPETDGGGIAGENSASAGGDVPSVPETGTHEMANETVQSPPPADQPVPVSTPPSYGSGDTPSGTGIVPHEPQPGTAGGTAAPENETEAPVSAPAADGAAVRTPDASKPALESEPEPEPAPAPSGQPPVEREAEHIPVWPAAICAVLVLGGAAAFGWQRGHRQR